MLITNQIILEKNKKRNYRRKPQEPAIAKRKIKITFNYAITNNAVMLGVTLCGGQSSRMGTDKGLLDLQGGNWTITAANKLSACQMPVVISVNKEQYTSYSVIIPTYPLITDSDELIIKGPLRGVLSVHKNYPAEDLFVLACDMPFMEIALLEKLIVVSNKQEADAYLFTDDGGYEPLCAIYTAKALAHLLSLAQSNLLQKHSMKYVLSLLKCATVAITTDQKKCFTNINAHADLNGL